MSMEELNEDGVRKTTGDRTEGAKDFRLAFRQNFRRGNAGRSDRFTWYDAQGRQRNDEPRISGLVGMVDESRLDIFYDFHDWLRIECEGSPATERAVFRIAEKARAQWGAILLGGGKAQTPGLSLSRLTFFLRAYVRKHLRGNDSRLADRH